MNEKTSKIKYCARQYCCCIKYKPFFCGQIIQKRVWKTLVAFPSGITFKGPVISSDHKMYPKQMPNITGRPLQICLNELFMNNASKINRAGPTKCK